MGMNAAPHAHFAPSAVVDRFIRMRAEPLPQPALVLDHVYLSLLYSAVFLCYCIWTYARFAHRQPKTVRKNAAAAGDQKVARKLVSALAKVSSYEAPGVKLTFSATTREPFIETVKEHCTTLARGFKPTSWLTNGHLQTIFVGFFSGAFHGRNVSYRRKILLLPDGGNISLDFSPPNLAPRPIPLRRKTSSRNLAAAASLAGDTVPEEEETIPTVVIFHGMVGGSHEGYIKSFVRHVTQELLDGDDASGYPPFRTVVVHSRGCGYTNLTTPHFAAVETDDTRCALAYLRKALPKSPLVGIGFSLGANLLAKYMGEEGTGCLLDAGVVIGNMWDLDKGVDLLENGSLPSRLYGFVMGLHLRQWLLSSTHRILDSSPLKHCLPSSVPPYLLTIHGFHSYTSYLHAGRPHSTPFNEGGFPRASPRDFYVKGSSVRKLKGCRKPMLIVQADDDPVVPEDCLLGLRKTLADAHSSPPNVCLVETRGGGHLGFAQGPTARPWINIVAREFLTSVLLDGPAVDQGLPLLTPPPSPLSPTSPTSPSSPSSPSLLRGQLPRQFLEPLLTPPPSPSPPSSPSSPSRLRNRPSRGSLRGFRSFPVLTDVVRHASPKSDDSSSEGRPLASYLLQPLAPLANTSPTFSTFLVSPPPTEGGREEKGSRTYREKVTMYVQEGREWIGWAEVAESI